MMNSTQRRYTNSDLLRMLEIWTSDYNTLPTQRDILDDNRMPTHHTFNKWFGSVHNALELAGLVNLESSNLHAIAVQVFEHYGIVMKWEYVDVNGMIVDFLIEDRQGNEWYVDIVDMKGVEDADRIAAVREDIAAAYDNYRQCRNVGDIIDLAIIQ